MKLWPFGKSRSQEVPQRPDDAEAYAPSPAAPKRPDPHDENLARLLTCGLPGGVSEEEGLRLFRALRSSVEEGLAIQACVTRAEKLPGVLAVELAKALVDRGDEARALEVLAGHDSAAALATMADVHATRGAFANAIPLIERTLLRDWDYPGARERLTRWRAAIGIAPRAPQGAANADTLLAPQTRAPFVVLCEVGRGGSGAVYEAEDQVLGRRTALKIYHDPRRARAQLLHEARIAKALGGAGIVRVFDVDPEQGWLAMEWAAKGSLRDRLRAQPGTDVATIAAWAVPLANALARVHAAGWVHLDVKPSNVLLRAQNEPVLSDFGIARRAGEANAPGSHGYVSPERLGGEPAHPRDDVYAFGRLLQDALGADGDRVWQKLAAWCTSAERPTDGSALVSETKRAASRG